LWLVVLPSG